MFPCTYKSSVCFQCRIFINSGCAKQEKVLRMLISCHLPKSCPFLSSSCHSLSVLCRAAYPFSVVFHYLVDGCCCLLGRFPCPTVFSLSPAFSFFLVWICMFSPLFQISALSSPFLGRVLDVSLIFWNAFPPPLIFVTCTPCSLMRLKLLCKFSTHLPFRGSLQGFLLVPGPRPPHHSRTSTKG